MRHVGRLRAQSFLHLPSSWGGGGFRGEGQVGGASPGRGAGVVMAMRPFVVPFLVFVWRAVHKAGQEALAVKQKVRVSA